MSLCIEKEHQRIITGDLYWQCYFAVHLEYVLSITPSK